MLELIISYFLTKFNIITKKPNNPDCHLNRSVSMEAPPGFEPGIKALQASALPLGYSAIYINLITDKTKDAF